MFIMSTTSKQVNVILIGQFCQMQAASTDNQIGSDSNKIKTVSNTH